MLKELLASTAVVLALVSPAYAASSDTSAKSQMEARHSESPCNPCAAAATEQTEIPSATANPCVAAALENPCSPESSSASNGDVIAVQAEDEGRMENLIGMPVSNSLDEEVGSVTDVLFTRDGKISGVVLSVGGFLGIGDKLVALPWDDVEVRYDEEQVLIASSRDELDAAQSFKTLEQARAEEQALKVQQEQQRQMQQNLQMQEQQQ